jgi:glycosyltransferase involved in cell wall biosynthesis
VFSTRKLNPAFVQHIIESSGLGKKIEVIPFVNNGEKSLTQVYNEGLEKVKHDIVVFCHDDIIFNTKDWGLALSDHFTRNMGYGIFGVAGTNKLTNGRWWEDKSKMFGIVNHSDGKNVWTNAYSENQGLFIKRMVALDGVFFAAHKKRIKTKFNENFKGFHFYDISFTFENYINNVKIGVITNIRITDAVK